MYDYNYYPFFLTNADKVVLGADEQVPNDFSLENLARNLAILFCTIQLEMEGKKPWNKPERVLRNRKHPDAPSQQNII